MITKIQQETFLREFFRNTELFVSLSPEDPRYVRLYDDPSGGAKDPIAELRSTLDWSEDSSAHLFSGFRGSGKSTELRRLQQLLSQDPTTLVLRCDMQEYINITAPVDITDFLLAVAGAFSEAVQQSLGLTILPESYYARFIDYLRTTEVSLEEIGLHAETEGDAKFIKGKLATDLKLTLRSNPTVLRRIQERMAVHVTTLSRDVHEFFRSSVASIRANNTGHTKVVLLLDSIEQISGNQMDSAAIFDSVVRVFRSHSEKLKLPNVHVVYTAPPWLKFKAPGIDQMYATYKQIPCVPVRRRDGVVNEAGVDLLIEVVSRRGDWRELFGDNREAIREICLASGGYLRSLLAMVREACVKARYLTLPINGALRRNAMDAVASTLRVLSEQDKRWLAEIRHYKTAKYAQEEQLPALARLFEHSLVLNYDHEGEWLDAHPFVWDLLPPFTPTSNPDSDTDSA